MSSPAARPSAAGAAAGIDALLRARGRFGPDAARPPWRMLLAMLVGRITLPEMPFRASPLAGLDTGDGAIMAPGHIDLASVTFGVAILLAGVFWLVGEAMRGRLRIRAGSLGVMIAMFSAWSLVSAIQGGDRRGALLFWGNQAGLMLAGWLAIQLCCRSKHRAALLAVTAAAGVMLAVIGLRQVFIDAPERIADFEARGGEILATHGWTPQTPEAIAFKERLFKAVPLGFFSLANVFASVMIVLTASVVGLLADRWRKVIPDRQATASSRKSGEIHLPTLAAAIMTAGAPLCVVALVLAVSDADRDMFCVKGSSRWSVTATLAPPRTPACDSALSHRLTEAFRERKQATRRRRHSRCFCR